MECRACYEKTAWHAESVPQKELPAPEDFWRPGDPGHGWSPSPLVWPYSGWVVLSVNPQSWAREYCGLGLTRIGTPDRLVGDCQSGELDGYQFLCLPLVGSSEKNHPLRGWRYVEPGAVFYA